MAVNGGLWRSLKDFCIRPADCEALASILIDHYNRAVQVLNLSVYTSFLASHATEIFFFAIVLGFDVKVSIVFCAYCFVITKHC